MLLSACSSRSSSRGDGFTGLIFILGIGEIGDMPLISFLPYASSIARIIREAMSSMITRPPPAGGGKRLDRFRRACRLLFWRFRGPLLRRGVRR